MVREQFAGPDSGPEPPFPIRIGGPIIKGFGRGSREAYFMHKSFVPTYNTEVQQLGIPTANIPIEGVDIGGKSDIESGVYYGFAGLSLTTATTEDASSASNPTVPAQTPADEENIKQSQENASTATTAEVSHFAVYPMVMSIGWNPYYKNEKRSVEVHIIHKFEKDFYNSMLKLDILGFIRHERDYDSLDALIEDIKIDIEVAERSLQRPAYQQYAEDAYLKNSS